MREARSDADIDYPQFGARARCWRRFERGFEEWLATPDGAFALWSARRQIEMHALGDHDARDAATGRGQL
ncbi:MAG: hypothetical protein AB7V42_01375 [Thermoleophilia bacterium]